MDSGPAPATVEKARLNRKTSSTYANTNIIIVVVVIIIIIIIITIIIIIVVVITNTKSHTIYLRSLPTYIRLPLPLLPFRWGHLHN